MPARPHVAVLCSWIATLGILGTAAVVARAPAHEREAIVQTAAPRPTTTAPPTTTTAPATTTTTAPPPPPTTVPPPPPPPTTVTPRLPARTTPPTTVAPPPASVVEEPSAAATADYAMSLIQQVVPARWLAAVPVHFQVVPGNTSWSSWGGLIEIGDWHLTSSVARAHNVLTHEWGHQVAWLYGTDAYNGAPPAGFPYAGRSPEEQWADCVAQALTGTSYPTGGLGPCPSDALAFTASFFSRRARPSPPRGLIGGPRPTWSAHGKVREAWRRFVGPRQMEERSVRVKLGQVIVAAAALLLAASAVGLLGTWALGVGLVVLVGSSVVTAIVWEEREAPPSAPSVLTSQVPRGR